MQVTHIWVSSDLLDDLLIEMSRVTQKASSDIVCVLKSTERCYRELRSLGQIPLSRLDLNMLVLYPIVMRTSCSVCNVFLEYNNIGIGDLCSLCRGKKGSGFVVDGVNKDWGG